MSTVTDELRLELAAGKHTPSKAMRQVAARGVAAAKNHSGVATEHVAVGRKIAAGQHLSHDQVRGVASYHAAHEYDCSVDPTTPAGAADMCMGGAPGAAWSAARSAALDVSDLSESPLELAAGDELTLEIFIRDGFGEPTELTDSEGLIWAPILRSGTLATRPGPYGEKLRDPLVIVPGRTADPSKEIGLENLLANFKAGAIQHVTIPTSHENGVLENNGYIVDMRIDDSTKRVGERVLMGAHKVTEPDVLGRLTRGSVANRSCGILHDYVDTETGTTYDQVVEHVALTNKPWVRGMAAYGDLAEVDLSARQVVPMMLSEAPHAPAPASDSAWDDDVDRFTDSQYANSCVVDRGAEAAERFALPICEPDGTLNSLAVHVAAGMLLKLGDVTTAAKRTAAAKLIVAYRQLGEEPANALMKLVASSTKVPVPTALADVQWGETPSLNTIRDKVTAHLSNFRNEGEPGGPPYYYVMDVTADKALVQIEYAGYDVDDAWIVPLAIEGDDVKLADFAQWTPVEKAWVTDEDAAQDKNELAAILGPGGMPIPQPESEALFAERTTSRRQLHQERHHQQGGAPMPATTQDVLDRLELSDEAKAVLQKIADENRVLHTRLAETEKESRKALVAGRVKELEAKGFSPGFLNEYERIALADDGQPAAVLNLSEGGVARDVEHTATQLAERLIAAMPFDESGKLALAGQANLIESPAASRPALSDADAAAAGEAKPGEKTGDDLLAEWAEADPNLINNFRTKLADAK